MKEGIRMVTRKTKFSYGGYKIIFLLAVYALSGSTAFSSHSVATSASHTYDLTTRRDGGSQSGSKDFPEERMAVQDFIDHVNEARRELAMRQVDIAKQKIIMARGSLPIIARVTPMQRRLTRVEFGGGFYANDLNQKKIYSPIETKSIESLTQISGPRWVKNIRAESDSRIIYVTLDLTGDRADIYLKQAEKDITEGKIKNAEVQLAELSDFVIKIDDTVPSAVQARDYITLADNYIRVTNFFGARQSLEKANVFLKKMRSENKYKPHQTDIITLRSDIESLQTAFAKLDASQINAADVRLKKWREQLDSWDGE
jgi:hypothetical protein